MNDMQEAMFELFVVADRVSHHMYAKARASLGGGVPATKIMMALLREPGRTDREIGWQIGRSSSQISGEMRRLIEAGLVSTRQSPDHRGQRLLELTAAGREAALTIRGELARAFDEAYAEETKVDQRELLERALSRDFTRPLVTGRYDIRPILASEWPWLYQYWLSETDQRGGAEELQLQRITALMHWLVTKPSGRDDLTIVVADRSKLIGAALTIVGDAPDEPDLHSITAWIAFLRVDRTSERETISFELIERCKTTARALDMLSLNARVTSDDGELGELLKSAGFKKATQRGQRRLAGDFHEFTLLL